MNAVLEGDKFCCSSLNGGHDMNHELELGIAQLLRRTGSARGQYETTVLNGVYDENWASWYADWAIKHGLNDLMGTAFHADDLGEVLFTLSEEHTRDSHGLGWPEFYAKRLVEMFAQAAR
jgi:hypothetical protein